MEINKLDSTVTNTNIAEETEDVIEEVNAKESNVEANGSNIREHENIEDSIEGNVELDETPKLGLWKRPRSVRPGCDSKCHLKCSEKISFSRRKEINSEFWSLIQLNKKWKWIAGNTNFKIHITKCKRLYTNYSLKNYSNTEITVC